MRGDKLVSNCVQAVLAQFYNSKVKNRTFRVGDLVLRKVI